MNKVQEIKLALTFPDTPANMDTLSQWLVDRAKQHNLKWLLAHADDGVIWGYVDEDTILHLSGEVFPQVSPLLRSDTLQQARLFAEGGELLLWRDATGWHTRLVAEDTQGTNQEVFDEAYLLWGNNQMRDEDIQRGFSLLSHGQEGLRHAIPQSLPTGKPSPKLKVRHVVDYDRDGQAYVAMSCLRAITE